MIKKSILICFVFFAIQTVLSCDICDCPRSRKLEVNYTGLTLKAYNTAGFQNTLANDTVFVNAFGLEFSLDANYVEIANRLEGKPNFGFESAFACDCAGDNYIYSDSLDLVQLLVTNTATQEEKEVTSAFAVFDYFDNAYKPLTDPTIWQDNLWLDLVAFKDIPKSAIFTVIVTLKSGVKFTAQTETINFY
jgi:hypothetical protein